jgi:hypothetical protein
MAGKPGEKSYGRRLDGSRCASDWWATWYDPLTIEEGVHPARSTESGQGTIRDHLPNAENVAGQRKEPSVLDALAINGGIPSQFGIRKGKAQLTPPPSQGDGLESSGVKGLGRISRGPRDRTDFLLCHSYSESLSSLSSSATFCRPLVPDNYRRSSYSRKRKSESVKVFLIYKYYHISIIHEAEKSSMFLV